MSTDAAAHRRRREWLMHLLGFLTAVEFLENAMFVFGVGPIMEVVHAGPQAVVQVQAAYAIATMLVLVKQHWLAERLGYRRYLCGALALFAIGALGCGASGSVESLTAARFVQGLGGGALFTSSRVLVNEMFPAAERAPALRRFIVYVFSAAAVGPLLAAALVTLGDGSWIFYGIVPLALLALSGCARLLPDAHPGRTPAPWAWRSLLWFALGAIALQVGLSEASYALFSRPLAIVATCAAALALLLGFFVHQWRHPAPLLALRELNSPVYLTGLGLYFLYYLLTNFGNTVFPVFVEHGLGMDLVTTGALNSLGGLAGWLMAMAYVRWAKLLPRKKPLMLAGLVAMVAAALWFAYLPAGTGAWGLMPGIVAKGCFGVLMVLPIAGLSYRELGEARFAQAYQAKNLLRQIAISLSTALATVAVHERALAVHGATGASSALAQRVASQQMYLVLAVLVVGTMAAVLLQRRLD